jgi:hypothetical protein
MITLLTPNRNHLCSSCLPLQSLSLSGSMIASHHTSEMAQNRGFQLIPNAPHEGGDMRIRANEVTILPVLDASVLMKGLLEPMCAEKLLNFYIEGVDHIPLVHDPNIERLIHRMAFRSRRSSKVTQYTFDRVPIAEMFDAITLNCYVTRTMQSQWFKLLRNIDPYQPRIDLEDYRNSFIWQNSHIIHGLQVVAACVIDSTLTLKQKEKAYSNMMWVLMNLIHQERSSTSAFCLTGYVVISLIWRMPCHFEYKSSVVNSTCLQLWTSKGHIPDDMDGMYFPFSDASDESDDGVLMADTD